MRALDLWNNTAPSRRIPTDDLRRSHFSFLPSPPGISLGAVGAPEFDHLPREKKPEAGLLELRAALGGFAGLCWAA